MEKGAIDMDAETKNYCRHFSELFGVNCNVLDISSRAFPDEINSYCVNCCKSCEFSATCSKHCDCINTHLYGCYEAVRWGNQYIYYCSKGFIFIAIALLDENQILNSGIVLGPILMGNPEDFETHEAVPFFETAKVNHLASLMSAVFVKKQTKNAGDTTLEYLNSIYKELDEYPAKHFYPFELEKELQHSIRERNVAHAKEILNKFLAQIFFHSNADFEVIKARVTELIVLLSRSAIDAGANVEQIFFLNNNYIQEISRFQTQEKLNHWLISAINRFVGYVFEFHAAKHADIIFKITTYIKNNYMKKISLDDISEHIYLSKSYISKIFKEEMNISLSNYINQVRIDKSKLLLQDDSLSLADVANLIGFDDQSYFTKTFKKIVGVSPGKFRTSRNISN
ncbi:MAG: AraC family transcriptional regulator [Ruminococcaceae bacterium]|nr:AraC family transcriptional regulator [Oscillospiraceae bacterium]